MQVSINDGISIHLNMNMIIGICRSFNVNTRIELGLFIVVFAFI